MVFVPLLSLAWAVLLASPLVVRARRASASDRARALSARPRGRHRRPQPHRLALPPGWREFVGVRVFLAPVAQWRSARTSEAIARELPLAVDLLGVAIGSGCTPYLALQHATRWTPPAIAASLDSVVRQCGLGAGFADAWADVAERVPQLQPLADALTASERTGAPVGPALARLAADERAATRRRVESHARRVPVRLLFPLVFLVLPAFVVLTVVPGLAAGLARL